MPRELGVSGPGEPAGSIERTKDVAGDAVADYGSVSTDPGGLDQGDQDAGAAEEIIEQLTGTNAEGQEDLQDILCPICNESMVTLEQLNQHLDDAHVEPPGDKDNQSAPKDGWSAIGRFFRDEINAIQRESPSAQPHPPQQPRVMISRDHWQKAATNVACSAPGCDRTPGRGGYHCRECGHIFCRPHASFRKKLDKHAHADPGGMWCRVCEGCFRKSEWCQDGSGLVKDYTSQFMVMRAEHADARALIVDRLEKRLVRLIAGITDIDRESSGLLTFKENQRRKDLEQHIVVWEDEKPVIRCRLCGQRFTYLLRKHHCRVCGRVVCGELNRECSREVPTSLLAEKLGRGDLRTACTFPLRICIECRNAVFARKNFQADVSAPPSNLIQLFTHLKHRRTQVDALLPRFHGLAEKLGQGGSDPGLLAEMKEVRKQLLSTFTQFDGLARRIRQDPVDSPAEEWVKQRISLWATEFLQQTMLPLQALPRILQQEERPRLRKDEIHTLQNKMVVLGEQKFMVQGMVSDAKQRRRFDEIQPLELSLADLNREMDSIREHLGSLAPQ